jgi:hypothetical protein
MTAAVVSGGGGTGATVSFRADAGGGGSHADSTTADSSKRTAGLRTIGRKGWGESRRMPRNLYGIVAPSIDET